MLQGLLSAPGTDAPWRLSGASEACTDRIDTSERAAVYRFFMFIRPQRQPYTCLGIEWLTPGVPWPTIFHLHFYKAPTLLLLFGNSESGFRGATALASRFR